jgi:O-antigen/teichoic acid export membrane protein
LSIFITKTEKPGQTIKQRLVKNSLLLISAEAISKLTAFLIQIIAARHLGSQGYGMFSYAFVGTGVLLNFVDHGFRVYTTREISNDFTQAKTILKNILFLKKIITTISIVIISTAYTIIPLDSKDLQVIFLISIAMIVDGYSEINLGVFRAFEKMKEVSILMISQRALFFITGGLGILFLDFGIVQFSSAFLLTTTLFFLISRKMVRSLLDKEIFEEKRLNWRSVLENSTPICLVIFFSYIYFRLDVAFLFFLHGKAEVGFYTASFKIIESLALMIAGIRASLFPVISRDTFHDSRQLSRISRELYRVLLLICVPISIGIIFISEYLVEFLYGPDYGPTSSIIKIMGASFFLIALNEFSIFLLLAVRKTQIAIKITLLAAIFNFTLNCVLIPDWGTFGAAISFAFTQVFIFSLAYMKLKKNLGIVFPCI